MLALTTVVRIQDIPISRRINERGVFNIALIQPAGSMAEKTSLWKSSKSTRYLEFDFLGVLERSCMLQTQENCPECMKVTGVLVNTELLGRYGYIDNYTSFHSGEYIYEAPKLLAATFKGEVNSSVVSSCSCFRLRKATLPSHNEYPFVIYTFYPQSSDCQPGCAECTVTMPTGDLQIATDMRNHTLSVMPDSEKCSLTLIWSSHAKSLYAPDNETFKNIYQCSRLSVFVDFVPAIELFTSSTEVEKSNHFGFLVPKRCALCDLRNST